MFDIGLRESESGGVCDRGLPEASSRADRLALSMEAEGISSAILERGERLD